MYSLWDNFPTKLQTSLAADIEFNGEAGLPHSEIVGSKFAHNSPTLIAACHVLHRLCMPRHPPNALTSRLRVHTANVRADESAEALPPTLQSTIWKKSQPVYSRRQSSRELDRRSITASISNPFTMSKRRAPKGALTGRSRICCLHS